MPWTCAGASGHLSWDKWGCVFHCLWAIWTTCAAVVHAHKCAVYLYGAMYGIVMDENRVFHIEPHRNACTLWYVFEPHINWEMLTHTCIYSVIRNLIIGQCYVFWRINPDAGMFLNFDQLQANHHQRLGQWIKLICDYYVTWWASEWESVIIYCHVDGWSSVRRPDAWWHDGLVYIHAHYVVPNLGIITSIKQVWFTFI